MTMERKTHYKGWSRALVFGDAKDLREALKILSEVVGECEMENYYPEGWMDQWGPHEYLIYAHKFECDLHALTVACGKAGIAILCGRSQDEQ